MSLHFNIPIISSRASWLGLSVLIFGCDFISTASEITFGEGSLPAMKQEMTYPSVDEFIGFDESESIPGLPDSLNQGTLAHLVGALSATGECGRIIEQGDLGDAVRAAQFELAACTEDQRCSALCPEGFQGLTAVTRLEVVVMTTDQSKELQRLLSEDSSDSILQVRFQMKGLEFFQGAGANRVVTNQYIEDFEMWLSTPDGEPLLFLGPEDLARIYAAAELAQGQPKSNQRFERYELPRTHPMTRQLITDILSGQDVVLLIEQRFKIKREALYDLKLSPAGAYQSIQPEVVINAIEAATSSL